MTCPNCGGKLRVVDNAHTPNNVTLRKKTCTDCASLVRTVETVVKSYSIFEFEQGFSNYHRDRFRKDRPRRENL